MLVTHPVNIYVCLLSTCETFCIFINIWNTIKLQIVNIKIVVIVTKQWKCWIFLIFWGCPHQLQTVMIHISSMVNISSIFSAIHLRNRIMMTDKMRNNLQKKYLNWGNLMSEPYQEFLNHSSQGSWVCWIISDFHTCKSPLEHPAVETFPPIDIVMNTLKRSCLSFL